MSSKICVAFISIFIHSFYHLPALAQAESIYPLPGFSERINSYAEQSHQSSLAWDYDIVFSRCNWYVDPALHFIEGEVSFYFITADTGMNKFSIHLHDSMIVDSILIHGSQAFFMHSNGQVDISLPLTPSPGIVDSLTIYYKGSPQSMNDRGFQTALHGGVPIAYTLSEPFSASQWWPCKESLTDKIDSIEISVTSPLQYRTASNGILIQEDSTGTERTCRWKSRYPIAPYLVAIGITNYEVLSDSVTLKNSTLLPLVYYAYPESMTLARSVMAETKKIISLFDSVFNPYPFYLEKYGHAEFSWPGGMEHQTMSFLGNYAFGLIAHECAHQWFGDYVTNSSWSDIWLHEGFATYLTGLYVEFLHPDDWNAWKQATLSLAVSVDSGSTYCDDTTSLSRIFDGALSYNKGAYLVHMLRWMTGDANFFGALNDLLDDTRYAYSYFSTENLKAHLEHRSQQDLTTFFNEWFYGSGYPDYNIFWKRTGFAVEIEINQLTSSNDVSFFHLPIPLQLVGDEKDSIIVIAPLFSGQKFLINTSFLVNDIFFDPEKWILTKNSFCRERNEEGAEQMELYPNPASNEVSIYSSRPDLYPTGVIITDNLGKTCKQFHFKDSVSRQKIDVSNLDIGVYILSIVTSEGMLRKKLIIRK